VGNLERVMRQKSSLILNQTERMIALLVPLEED
jgi:hypothetical protein